MQVLRARVPKTSRTVADRRSSWRPGEWARCTTPRPRNEALWLAFDAPWWKPHVLKVGIIRVDAISGETLNPGC